MKKSYVIFFLIIALVSVSCTKPQTKITNPSDYNQYLTVDNIAEIKSMQKEHDFWLKKLEEAPNQYPYLSKMAAEESNLFAITGKIRYLVAAEKYLYRANQAINNKNVAYLRALARNYISQHRFKEALVLLLKAEKNGYQKLSTQKMLFDIYLELGNYEKAKEYLVILHKENDFDYLIRFSKWNDHLGKLDTAINYMEKAKDIAVKSTYKGLMLWAYTNLADFYGHANRIKDSYDLYLKALAIDPNSAYAKKGIAWIVYSYEKDTKEAMRILNAITAHYNTPDYYLFKAEIAEYSGNIKEKNNNINAYLSAVKNKQYGVMYNKYNVLLFAEQINDVDTAMVIAQEEIDYRPTPESYDLLAWCYYKKGDFKKALEIAKENIVNKTFEPEVQYHLAKIYKANGINEPVIKIKKELLESAYELGPLMISEIEML